MLRDDSISIILYSKTFISFVASEAGAGTVFNLELYKQSLKH